MKNDNAEITLETSNRGTGVQATMSDGHADATGGRFQGVGDFFAMRWASLGQKSFFADHI